MTTAKPIFMRTYGKTRRKLTPWISPKNHKQAFDSSLSSDDSLVELDQFPKTRKRKVSVAAALTRGKKRLIISESEDDLSFSVHCQKVQLESNPTSKAKKGTSKAKKVRPMRGKLKENSTDEDIFSVPFPSCPQPVPRNRATRKLAPAKAAVTFRRKEQDCPISTESNEDLSPPAKRNKNPLQINTTSNLPHVSPGCFVTRRRPITTKVQASKVKVFNSLEDFTSGEESQVCLASKKKRVPLAILESSLENSTSDLDADALQNILPNDSAGDHSLGTRPRKPIFCSTPSVRLSSKRPRIAPVTNESPNPTSLSVSRISANACQDDQDSPSQPCCSPPIVLHSNNKQQSRLSEPNEQACPPFHEGHSEELFTHPLSMNTTNRDGKRKTDGASLHLPTADNCLVSMVEDLLSLTEVLKEECLAQPCTVRMTRLDSSTVRLFCSQTTDSSCLTDLSSAHRSPTPERHPICVDMLSSEQSYRSSLAATEDQTCELSTTGTEPESQTSSISISLALSQSLSAESDFKEVSASAHTSNFESFTRAQLTASSSGKMSPREQNGTFQGNNCKVVLERFGLEEIQRTISQRLSVERQHNTSKGESPLIQKGLTDPLTVRLPRLTLTQLKELQQKGTKCQSSTSGSDSTSSGSDKVLGSDREAMKKPSKVDKRASRPVGKKKKKKKKSPSTDRPGTTRKACVSGLSVSRWKNDSRLQAPRTFKRKSARRAADCTISDLISAEPADLQGLLLNFSTPVRTCPLNMSSLLDDDTPRTQHWNRFKSSLSIHRKMLLTPQSCKRPVPRDVSLLDLSDAEKVYAECGQPGSLPWKECFSALQMKQCVKIGEGTFGEVFSTSNSSGETIALKVIPLEGSEKVNGEDQKTFGEILHEIIISKELSRLKDKHDNQTNCFIGLNNLHCVRGCYPPEFLKAWDNFDRKKGSENDRPDLFQNDQLFIILEFEFGGVDLENSNGTLSSLVVAKSILHQVTAALAVAEQELHFEHRDLHWGNVLVKTTKEKTGSFLFNGAPHSLETKGVFVRIIDYSLSRLEIDGLTVSCDISNDEELFMGQGDYQFDIYRHMREENGNDWNSYHPHSNVLWLHYLCSKLLSMRYRGTGGKSSKDALKELTQFKDTVLQFTSATEALQTCPMFK
ncbi:uncharacterized protein haspin [Syngnathus typhle]|uniref:uncharacterized protein haspin n=1 Tax=Syngnathus typhle TaxID=161592 RepID=UPI002A69F849|nr:uncharacterized protein haspin [Syngnathus typhle]XP_061130878.1 uncharacterized protein haspin [Syngnathus typhle]